MSDELFVASVQQKLLLDGAGEQTAASVQQKVLLSAVDPPVNTAAVQRKLLLLNKDSPRDIATIQRKIIAGRWPFYVVKDGEPRMVKFLGIYDKTANVVKPARYYPVSSLRDE